MRVLLINDQGERRCVVSLEVEQGGEPWGEVITDAAGVLRLTVRPPLAGGVWELTLTEVEAALATVRQRLLGTPPDDAPHPAD